MTIDQQRDDGLLVDELIYLDTRKLTAPTLRCGGLNNRLLLQ